MQISLTKTEPISDLTILPLFVDQKPDKNKNLPQNAVADFKNRVGSTHLIYADNSRVLLLGLGDKKEFNNLKLRSTIHVAVNAAIGLGVKSANFILPKINPRQLESYLELSAFSFIFSSYKFDAYKKNK